MNLLEKIRNQSETRKKTILWSIIIVIAFTFFFFYIGNIKKSIEKLRAENLKEEIKFPSLSEELKEMEENLKKLNEQKQATTTE